MTTEQQMNDAIADHFGEDNPELRNWLATQHGRKFAGLVTEAPAAGKCPICERPGQIAKRRRNSSYANDEENWLVSCEECFKDDTHCLDEMWEDYYSMTR